MIIAFAAALRRRLRSASLSNVQPASGSPTGKLGRKKPRQKLWSADRVRSELPDVRIECAGAIVIGYTRGRFNQLATVIVPRAGVYHFPWSAVARSLNTGSPLKGI